MPLIEQIDNLFEKNINYQLIVYFMNIMINFTSNLTDMTIFYIYNISSLNKII